MIHPFLHLQNDRHRVTGRRTFLKQLTATGAATGVLQLGWRDMMIAHAEELRKRGKRLRYGLSFAESLLPAAKLRGYRKLLSRAQDVLGEINDLAMAKDYYQSCTATHPQAWFALGWISARLDELVIEAQMAFDDLAQSKPFWK